MTRTQPLFDAPKVYRPHRRWRRGALLLTVCLTAVSAWGCSTPDAITSTDAPARAAQATVEPTGEARPVAVTTAPPKSPTSTQAGTTSHPDTPTNDTPTSEDATSDAPGKVAGQLATTPSSTTDTVKVARYLALGDSLPAGWDVTSQAPKTAVGYPIAVAQAAAQRMGVTRVDLVNLACSGERIATYADGKGPCDYSAGSQHAAALEELKRSGPVVSLITIHLGANDLWPCFDTPHQRDCAFKGRRSVGMRYPKLLRELKAHAPQATIVVLDYHVPQAIWVPNYDVPDDVDAILRDAESMNETIEWSAGQAGVQLASVSAAFKTPTHDQLTPEARQRLCEWTAICKGRDTHPTVTGHNAIGGLVLDLLNK